MAPVKSSYKHMISPWHNLPETKQMEIVPGGSVISISE
jgi:hypothetical protein